MHRASDKCWPAFRLLPSSLETSRLRMQRTRLLQAARTLVKGTCHPDAANAIQLLNKASSSSWRQGGPSDRPSSVICCCKSAASRRNNAAPVAQISRSLTLVTGNEQCSLARTSTSGRATRCEKNACANNSVTLGTRRSALSSRSGQCHHNPLQSPGAAFSGRRRRAASFVGQSRCVEQGSG
jgi:hypothetical protein